MKIWVIGANGLLGSSLYRQMPTLCVPSTKTEADIANLNSLRAFAKCHPGITHIVNCSAFSLVDLAETRRPEAHQINALGPENLGRIAQEIQAKVVHISTDYVFPGDLLRPLHEEDFVKPLNYYGETKWEGEKRLLAALPSACVIRTSALFGSGGKNFIANIFRMFLEKEEILLVDDQCNSPTFVEDLSLAIIQMLDTSGLYHFSNRGVATKFSFVSAMYRHALQKGIPVATKKLVAVPSSTFASLCRRPAYSVFDTSKMEQRLPIRTWEEALHSFLQGNL